MGQHQHKFASLMSVMTVLWSFCQGCPTVPGPTCAEELPNTIPIVNRLKKNLKELHETFVDRGYGGRELRGPVCILGNNGVRDQPMDLGTISMRLCQYAKCFQHFEDNIREINILPPSITTEIGYCQSYLKHLENTIKKMKPAASCATSCRVTWSFAETTWDEITKGARLAQELLTYLEQLRFSCS